MSQQSEPQLTPKQQALMDFLNQLATTPLTPEALAQGNQLLDAAADEHRQKQGASADSLPTEQTER
ncbi:MAG TPA: hypothetical protein V6C98_09505 [Thermosynechococcaceae cyanobacterium]|jgi:hypothetical protein